MRNKKNAYSHRSAHIAFRTLKMYSFYEFGLVQNNSGVCPSYGAKSRTNRILWLALNVVKYYIVRLKVIAKVVASTTSASEERKQSQIGETGKGNIRLST